MSITSLASPALNIYDAEYSRVVQIQLHPRTHVLLHLNHRYLLRMLFDQIQYIVVLARSNRIPQMGLMLFMQANSGKPVHGIVRLVRSCKAVDATHLLSHWRMAV
jgi:hypothetical protein